MNHKHIQELLERFYAGETSLDEEQRLRTYFQSKEVDASLQGEKAAYLACFAQEDIDVPDGLEARLAAVCTEAPAPNRTLFYKWASMAAAVALLFGVGFYSLNTEDTRPHETIEDPALAYLETQKALQLVTSRLNQGFKQLEEAEQQMGSAHQKLHEQFNKIAQ
ncbi:MAG: hypothetical protein AB7D40_11460 [Bacteroidales bacterium]